MVRKPRYELNNIILSILEDRKSLRYTELVDDVNGRCEEKKPSSSTFDRRLVDLEEKGILHRELHRDRSTYYSLTEKYATTYLEKTLQQFTTIRYPPEPESDDEKPIEIIEPLEDKST